MTWRLSESEAGVDLVLIKTLLLFTCKSCCSHANWFVFTYEKQEGLYRNKVNSSLPSTQRPGHQAHNCKMDYYQAIKKTEQFGFVVDEFSEF